MAINGGRADEWKECVAVLIGLYKKNGAVSHVRIDFLFTWCLYLARTCRKVVVIPGYPLGLDWVMGKYQQKLQHILCVQGTHV